MAQKSDIAFFNRPAKKMKQVLIMISDVVENENNDEKWMQRYKLAVALGQHNTK